MSIRTRFAPSPTGYLHIGGVRTALFSWLFARKHGGQFILRIEDTDPERSTNEAIQIILKGMEWLGLDYDEGPFYQSQRFNRYQEITQQLLDTGYAYHCYCSKEELDAMRETAMARGEKPRYNGRCRDRKEKPPKDIKPVIRFKNPLDGEVIVNDLIQGNVVFKNHELDDLIIARSDRIPTYNFTVVVDDIDMNISHVIRGDDHLNNTPRQMNIFKALNITPPCYSHVPLILGADGKRLSKRHGAVSVLEYKEQGYLPEALLNYLIRLGWSHGDQEIFSTDEMVQYFDIQDVNRSAASVNPDKLLWLNQHYLKIADNGRLAGLVKKYLEKIGATADTGPNLVDLVAVQKERTKTVVELAQQSICFFMDFDKYNKPAAKKHLKPDVLEPLQELRKQLVALEAWKDDRIHQAILDISIKFDMKLGKIAQPLRVAVTGGNVSPSIDVTLRLLGKQKTLARLDRALDYIQQGTSS